jgi:hypothetical protein
VGPNEEDFALAQANSTATSQAVGIVSAINGDDFTITYYGRVTGLSGLTLGVNFLSSTVAGGLTTTEPSISKPVLVATSATSGIIGLERGLTGGGPTTTTYRMGHTWAISGEIDVASGQDNVIIPFFVSLATGQTAQIVKARYQLQSGGTADVTLKRNGSPVSGFSGLTVTTTASSSTAPAVSIVEDDELDIDVNSITGTPENLTFTIFVEYMA